MIKGLCKLTGGRKSRAGLRIILTKGGGGGENDTDDVEEEEEEENGVLR
jgi:hypothetical protein